ncbi:hypothetical protein [Aegicerativicinus sediminis]|uniref:hypothetical protein n=1 Tax=Aegicerativicinus sediminis TaxID=2893202 RepID=UPI001E3BE2E7|nr:hypothetical protein [Aegicerativicinus sediminis]
MTLFKRFSLLFLGLTLITITGCSKDEPATEASLLSATASSDVHKAKNVFEYEVYFGELNNSGVTGMAKLMIDGTQLTVHIMAHGLEANQTHAQHIHGFSDTNRNATCPDESADTDMDGIVSLVEGIPFYGGVLISLTDFPMADENGNIDYMNTFTIPKDARPLQNNAIVLHGMTIDGEYWGTLPVACGQIMPTK